MTKYSVVTGPTGAVGVALINELVKNDYIVYAICRPHSSRINNIPKHENVKIIECDINELKNLANLIENEIYSFYHLAWEGTYGASRNDEMLQMNNIKSTIDAVNVAKQLKTKVFIGVGSQSEFGNTNKKKAPNDFCNPDNFYGAAKLSSMYMSKVLCSKLEIKHVWCRIFSLFGPGDGEYTLIMSTLKKLLSAQDCDFTKGEQIWDYIYSKDAAVILRKAAEIGKDNSIYCVASGHTKTLREYIESMAKVVGSKSKLNFGAIPYFPNQVMNLTADVSAIKEDLNFECTYTFEEGIKELIEGLKK